MCINVTQGPDSVLSFSYVSISIVWSSLLPLHLLALSLSQVSASAGNFSLGSEFSFELAIGKRY